MGTQPGDKSPGPEPFEARQQALFDMITGFRVSQMIFVVARLGIPDMLKDGPQDVETLALETGTHAPSLYRLLRALASMGIFAETDDGRFTLTPLAELLRSGVPGSQRAAALYHGDPSQWRTWGEFLYSITTGESAFQHFHGIDAWEYRAQRPELNAVFNDLMTANTRRQTAAVVSAYDFSGVGTLVDVAGGHGALIAAILAANPRLRAILCDASHVVDGAYAILDAAGVSDRCRVVSCDFFTSVPGGGDAYLLKLIIHDWDDDQAIAILNTCRNAMPEHGRLLLVENVIPPGNIPHVGKINDLQMLVALGGRERTAAEFGDLLARAGFKLTRIVPTQSHLSIVEALPDWSMPAG